MLNVLAVIALVIFFIWGLSLLGYIASRIGK